MAGVYAGTTTHFVWDGNVPLHEWQEVSSDTGRADVTTWLFEQGTFIPAAKLAGNGESFSIVSDYLGTPLQAFDNNGNKVWEQELDIFGRKKRKNSNNSSFIPFKYQGQYEDVETGLYYNRFRYYDSRTGNYISQDPLSTIGGLNLYAYVHDSNSWIDPLGLRGKDSFPSWMSTKQGYERHHIIPYEHRNHEIFKVTGMNVNNATNMVYLPVKESIHPTKAVYYEFKLNGKPHAKYNALMKRKLDDLLERANIEGWMSERTRKELLNLEHDTRMRLNNARNSHH
ncbi:RHS repeat domain-containing protein [Prevotella jejuni]